MSSIGAAFCAATETAAPRAAASLSPARAAASRRNGARAGKGLGPLSPTGPGAKSRGPKTPEGKARSAQNALRHGLRAQQCVVLPGERASAFAAFEAALLAELAPQGALQTVLAQRIVAASWRLARSERLEAELFAEGWLAGRNLGRALIRDGNGAGAFGTLLRYRGAANAELWRALRTLKGLQAEQAARSEPAVAPAPRLLPEPREKPIEPEARANPGDSEPAPVVSGPVPPAAAVPAAIPCDRASARTTLPDEWTPRSAGVTLAGLVPSARRDPACADEARVGLGP